MSSASEAPSASAGAEASESHVGERLAPASSAASSADRVVSPRLNRIGRKGLSTSEEEEKEVDTTHLQILCKCTAAATSIADNALFRAMHSVSELPRSMVQHSPSQLPSSSSSSSSSSSTTKLSMFAALPPRSQVLGDAAAVCRAVDAVMDPSSTVRNSACLVSRTTQPSRACSFGAIADAHARMKWNARRVAIIDARAASHDAGKTWTQPGKVLWISVAPPSSGPPATVTMEHRVRMMLPELVAFNAELLLLVLDTTDAADSAESTSEGGSDDASSSTADAVQLTRTLTATAELCGRACQGRFVVVIECTPVEVDIGNDAAVDPNGDVSASSSTAAASASAFASASATRALAVVQTLRVPLHASVPDRPPIFESVGAVNTLGGSAAAVRDARSVSANGALLVARAVKRHIVRVPRDANVGDVLRVLLPCGEVLLCERRRPVRRAAESASASSSSSSSSRSGAEEELMTVHTYAYGAAAALRRGDGQHVQRVIEVDTATRAGEAILFESESAALCGGAWAAVRCPPLSRMAWSTKVRRLLVRVPAPRAPRTTTVVPRSGHGGSGGSGRLGQRGAAGAGSSGGGGGDGGVGAVVARAAPQRRALLNATVLRGGGVEAATAGKEVRRVLCDLSALRVALEAWRGRHGFSSSSSSSHKRKRKQKHRSAAARAAAHTYETKARR